MQIKQENKKIELNNLEENQKSNFKIMRFQSIQNNKIYRLYREDEIERLKKKIQQIKNRKNQHMGNSRQKHLLPFISPGFGFSTQRKRQIDKQNQRLQQKIKNAKNNHSNYYIAKADLINSSLQKKKGKSGLLQNITNRSFDNSLILPLVLSDRNSSKISDNNIKKEEQTKLNSPPESKSFRKQIMQIYHQSCSDLKKTII